jgi:hypothetical protein
MKKLILVNMLFFITSFCLGQNVDETKTIKSADEEVFMDDFISFQGRKYTIAMIDEASTFMVSEKHLEREIGIVEDLIEDYFENITTEFRTVSCSWDKGTKLYKIKQIDENKYIAVEWVDLKYGNKYYVYCHQKDTGVEQILQVFYKELRK